MFSYMYVYICVCVSVFVYKTLRLLSLTSYLYCTVCVILTTRWRQRLTIKCAAFSPPNYFMGHFIISFSIFVSKVGITTTMYYLMHSVQQVVRLKWGKLDSGGGGGFLWCRMWNQFPAVDTEIFVPAGKGLIVMLNQPSTPRSHFISTPLIYTCLLFFIIIVSKLKCSFPVACITLWNTHMHARSLLVGHRCSAQCVGGLGQVEERGINTRPAWRKEKYRGRENKWWRRDRHLSTRCVVLRTEVVYETESGMKRLLVTGLSDNWMLCDWNNTQSPSVTLSNVSVCVHVFLLWLSVIWLYT